MPYASYVLIACLVVFIGVAVANQRTIAKQLDNWQLLPQPERLSELYFADAAQLPGAVRLGSTQKLAFAVHNLEHQTTVYHYELSAISGDNGAVESLGGGILTLAHDQSQIINETIKVPALSPRTAIKIELAHESIAHGDKAPSTQKQAIQYWVKVVGFRP